MSFHYKPGSQLGGGGERGEASPSFFWKLKKGTLILEQKGPDFIQLWVKFSIEAIVLRVSRKKKAKCFPAGLFLLAFIKEIFITVPWFHQTSPAMKNVWLCGCNLTKLQNYSFCKSQIKYFESLIKSFEVPKSGKTTTTTAFANLRLSPLNL